jgi:hypothetical protein
MERRCAQFFGKFFKRRSDVLSQQDDILPVGLVHLDVIDFVATYLFIAFGLFQ